MIDTKDRILDSAERLFAEKGYAATSLRSIMAAAGANVASIHYYFRSKESLLEAVLDRRLEPANAERLVRLEEYQRSCGERTPEVEKVLEAFLAPTFRMASDPGQGGYTFVRLMGRLQAESDLLPGIVFARFGPVFMRFADALARALPELPPNEMFWRARLAMGATSQILRDAPNIKSLSLEGAPDWDAILGRVVSYLGAGFRAPVNTQQERRAFAAEERR